MASDQSSIAGHRECRPLCSMRLMGVPQYCDQASPALKSTRSQSNVDKGGSRLRLSGAQHLSGLAAGERVPGHLEPQAELHSHSWHLHPAGGTESSHAKP